jgi:hypothetical protein
MIRIFVIAGALGVVAGCCLAVIADVFPSQHEPLQHFGGGLIVAGAALVGLAFPMT